MSKRIDLLKEMLDAIFSHISKANITELDITWEELGEFSGDLPTPNIKISFKETT
jgi:hypothetical protein